MTTAAAEHEGNLVGECGVIPRARHVRAPWEKGGVERAIGYARQNFRPLRSFKDLPGVNAQARLRLKEVANQRQHRETGEKPHRCFQPESLHLSKPYYCASGKVNSADKLYLVIESVKPDHKHGIASNAPAGADRGEVVLGADPGCGE